MKKAKIFYVCVIILFPLLVGGAVLSSEYRVGLDDVLKISILGKMDYKDTENVTVNSSGKILISIMQEDVQVEGLTCSEIAAKLEKILGRDYLVDPKVLVEVVQYKSRKVLVIGEVKKPGEIALQSDRVTLKDLMKLTGGPVGDINKSIIITGDKAATGIQPKVYALDEILMSSQHDNVTVNSGDIIYVLGKEKSLPVQDLVNTVYVFGQVRNPGIIPFTKNMSALRAIIAAGNFTKEAAPARTTVKRRDAQGNIKTINSNLEKVMSGGDKSKDIILNPGDIVYVPRAIF